jgi:WD40 repeat protein
LQFWEPITHELLREVRGLGTDAIAFSPDGSQAVISNGGDIEVVDLKTWKFTRKEFTLCFPQFTPDGRHVLLNTRNSNLRMADTTTWEYVNLPTEIPPDAVCYMPAPGSKRAVVQLKSGAVILWDVTARRIIATLRDNARLVDTAFSPDESQFVVQTEGRIRNQSVASFWYMAHRERRPGARLVAIRTQRPGMLEGPALDS